MANSGTIRFPIVSVSDVGLPPSGKVFVFVDSDGHVKSIDSVGTINDLTFIGSFYGIVIRESDGSFVEQDDTIEFDSSDFNVADVSNKPRVTIVDSGIDHGSLSGLGDDDHPQYLLRTQMPPGFYGIVVNETDGNPPPYRTDTIYFDSAAFYLSSDSRNKPVVSFRPAATGQIAHSSLSGLTTGDDHTQYIRVDGTRAFTGDQSLGGFKITNVGAPVAGTDAARLQDIGPGFYGLSVKLSNNAAHFKNINVINFEAANFYIKQNVPNIDEVQVNFRGNAGVKFAISSFTSAVEWQFNHNLASKNLVWSVYETNDRAMIPGVVDLGDGNTAYFYFATARAGRVVLMGL
jgi:hypothetical protein